MKRRRILVTAVLGAAAVAGLTGAAVSGLNGHSPAAKSPARSYATSTVRRTDLSESDLVNGTLGWSTARPTIFRCRGTWTWLPNPGAIVKAGGVLARADDRPVVLLPGSVPAWRAMGAGTPAGPDIRQLQAALVALGFDPTHRVRVDGRFTAATGRAVRRWQASLQLLATGVVADGDVVFAPGPVRVGTVTVTLGGPAGGMAFATTGTARTVSVALDPGRQDGVRRGQAVTVDLLNGRTVSGTVQSLSPVATRSTDNSGQVTASLALTVLLPAAATGLPDGAGVQVSLITGSHRGVLAVPVTALLALAEGGYGVEQVSATGAHRIVAVRTGLFAGQDVEVSGGGLAAGDTVVVAR